MTHRRQPTRLPRPWDSPVKNTGAGCHFLLQCMKVKIESEVAQSCPTLSDPMDCSLPGSSVHGIFQARVLEWGAIASIWIVRPIQMTKVCYWCCCLITQSCPTLLQPHGLYLAHQALLSMGLFRQEHWSGLSFLSPEDLPNPGTKSAFPALKGRLFTTTPPGKPNQSARYSFFFFLVIRLSTLVSKFYEIFQVVIQ